MLTHIHILDFVIVDELELDLAAGMTAMTGETGAGKSILVDALGLALGDRADTTVVRNGADRAEINMSFDLQDAPAAAAWLKDQELDAHGDCVIRRVITQEGRSKGFINGRPVPMQSLRELGEMLVDIHGQHEHQSLLRRDTQRQLLDDYAGNGDLLLDLRNLYQQWKNAIDELEVLRTAVKERAARTDLLRFQIRELEDLNLSPSEITEIDEEHRRLSNAGALLETTMDAVTALYEAEEDTVHARLSRVSANLEAFCRIDGQLEAVRGMLNDALIQVEEAVDQLRRYTDRLELDPNRLQWVEERLGLIHDLSRKHQVPGEELPALLEAFRHELDGLDHSDERAKSLAGEIEALHQAYHKAATRLGKRRREAAAKLNAQVSALIQDLGMPGAQFEITVESDDSAHPMPNGLEQIDFLVSTNPGQPLKPLQKVASGGELSRFSLAIQVALANTTRIATLVYDEVDTGIGGGVAEVVGRQLRALGQVRQVLCVTHLPQVAAQAHHHLQVSKHATKGGTSTRIEVLSGDERIGEVARMLGGIEISEQSVAHAREMVEKAAAGAVKAKRSKKVKA